jgi:tetrahydromethanopterin S-methyltransferase subunit E
MSTNPMKEKQLMRIGSSLVLIAIGAILKFAVTTSVSGISLSTVGVVLMVVGIAGLVISLVLASTARRTDVVHRTTRGDYVDPPRGDDPRL